MNKLGIIKDSLNDELRSFERMFQKNLKGSVPLLNIILNYSYRHKGKQIRPLFVFLSAKLAGNITSSTYYAANLIELLHTATLIHDDIVDDSMERRGGFSIQALWKPKVSVLVGDYLLSQGLLIAVKNEEYRLLSIVSDAVKTMSEGELLQIQKSRKFNVSKEDYYTIIEKKTASLIEACTKAGAISSKANESDIEKLSNFGRHIGMAFQIRDDLFEFQKKTITGKSRGNDLKDNIITLPLLHALEQCSNLERFRIKRLLNKNKTKNINITQLKEFIDKYNGVKYAEDIMNDYKNKALEHIKDYPDSDTKNSLHMLAHYITKRNK